MSENKPKTSKRITKKTAEITEVVKPAKTIPKSAFSERAAAAKIPPKTTSKATAVEPVAVVVEPVAVVAEPVAVVAEPVGKPVAVKAAAKKSKTTEAKPAAPTGKHPEKPVAPSAEERQRWIATAAYHRYENRGRLPGYEQQDWADAEAEIETLIGKA